MSRRYSAGSPMRSGGHAPRTYAAGRTCNEPTCDTKLSRYNDTDHCALHRPAGTALGRGR